MNNEKWAHSILGFSSNEYAQTAGKVQGFGPCGAPLKYPSEPKTMYEIYILKVSYSLPTSQDF